MLPRIPIARLLAAGAVVVLPALSGCGGRDLSPVSPSSSAADAAVVAGNPDAPGAITSNPVSDDGAPDNHGYGYGAARWARHQLVAEVSPGWTSEQIDRKWGTDTMMRMAGSPFALMRMPEDADYDALSADLLASGACESCSRNYYVEAPEANQVSIAFYEGDLTSDDFADQDAFARVHTDLAHQRATGLGVTVAILDTGIDRTHPALAASVRSDGWDFVDEDSDPMDAKAGKDRDYDGLYDEAAGHGTHVAGVVHEVAPDARLLPVRVLDTEGIGTVFNLARGILYADGHGAQILNLSLGMEGRSPAVEWAIKMAHAHDRILVGSAGNDGVFTNLHFPSNLPEVIDVAAVDAMDRKADFSNFGNTVAITAPGVGIISTYLYHGYAVWSGTSMATPFVSGAAAIACQLQPAASADMLGRAVQAAAHSLDFAGEPYDGLLGAGRVDLFPLVAEGVPGP